MARIILFFIMIGVIVTTPSLAQDVPPMAMTNVDAALYEMPNGGLIGTLPVLTAVFVQERDENARWVRVRVIDDSASGWVEAASLLFSADVVVETLPVFIPPLAQSVPTSAPASFDLSTPEGQFAKLQSVPVLYNMASPEVASIFTRGQSLGNRANVFIKVGDSNTRSGGFLRPLGMGLRGGCDLGAYSDLQGTIDFFSVPPRPEFANSFDSVNMTAQDGLGTPGLLDPFRATDPLCLPNENPLACEYRLVKPSVAVMMIGLMDMKIPDLESYRRNLDTIIQFSKDQGVIPVLTTYSVLPDEVNPAAPMWDDHLRMNAIMIELVEKHGTPLINLWSALRPLPDYGIGPDRSHLKHEVGSFCKFTGAEGRVGGTLRNLVTLQALDELRKNILAR
jgi:hypothetical protein